MDGPQHRPHTPQQLAGHHRRRERSRHGGAQSERAAGRDVSCARVLLMGAPNVGKSVLFHQLTGIYVTVSNYPGTTVEVSKGYLRWANRLIEVVDTPGMYSVRPVSEEEAVARRMLLREHADAIVHVLDAKNIGRMLALTLQLMETGIPVIVVANMQDEAERLGLRMDFQRISERLGTPVLATSAVDGTGLDALREALLTVLSTHG